MPKSSDKVQIVNGKVTDQEVARKMCIFVIEKLKTDKIFTNTLFKTLIELMSNAVHHAYNTNNEELMYPCWYIYAEYVNDNKVQFIFVDTGLGIANTVRKNFLEKIRLKSNSDSGLIESAFNGEFRTETGKKNRGLGLPAIKDFVLRGNLNDFFVLSGKGSYKLTECNGKNILQKNDYINNILGTVYSFQIEYR